MDEKLVDELEEHYAEMLDYINAHIKKISDEIENDLGIDIASALGKGKRLRPFLCLLVCEACEGKITDAIPYAIIVELIHQASLILDDIIDKDELRRGIPSLHTLIGLAPAVLTSDAVFGKIIHKVTQYSMKAGHYVGGTIWEMCKGFIREALPQPILFNENIFLKINKLKTGSLFSLACRLGAFASNVSYTTEEIYHDYGMALGCAYQLADDLVDVLNTINKNELIGDVKEYKITYPIFLAFKERIFKYKQKKINVEEVINALKEHEDEIRSQTFGEINKLITIAQEKIRRVKKNKYGDMLEIMPEYVCQKILKEVK